MYKLVYSSIHWYIHKNTLETDVYKNMHTCLHKYTRVYTSIHVYNLVYKSTVQKGIKLVFFNRAYWRNSCSFSLATNSKVSIFHTAYIVQKGIKLVFFNRAYR